MTFPKATIVGYPRIGRNRELKRAEEAYWAGKISLDELKATAKELRLGVYARLKELGLNEDWAIPASFSYYDQVLDAAITFGALPKRFEYLRDIKTTEFSLNSEAGARAVNSFAERMRRPLGVDEIDLDGYFTVARGDKNRGEDGLPGEMTKWFDTNYHYIVPELHKDTRFSLANFEILRNFEEAKEAGYNVRPVIVGPVTFLSLAKYTEGADLDYLVEPLAASYARLLSALAAKGAKWIQFDEPAFVSQTHGFSAQMMARVANEVYGELSKLSVSGSERPSILVTTPFGKIDDDVLDDVLGLGVEALHLDLVRGEYDLHQLNDANKLNGKTLVAGLINGRNIWRAKLGEVHKKFKALEGQFGLENVTISTSCSLQHVPHTVGDEAKLGREFPELVSNLSFAEEKVNEVVRVAEGYDSCGRKPRAELAGRKVKSVHERVEKVSYDDLKRESIEERKDAQSKRLNLPLLPTTTIGSFPQTPEIRKARASFKKGDLSASQYENAMKDEIKACVELQERLDIDVLVHGEAERNDMVQYFAENFEGFDVTENGWVQSYGSRCTKPSVLWGDVYREEAFTVPWISYAQSLTSRPMKGMLTGPVTILAWSFVRDDQPLSTTANQVALALRDEIEDLEQAGIAIIQVDEPALRELLPLKKADQSAYLKWSVDSFRLATSSVRVDTQIHTHLCYSEFEIVLPAIIALNADVTSIEAARSKMEIVPQLVNAKYPLGIGPGVYDIHSPRVPSQEEIEDLLNYAVQAFKDGDLPISDLWVNPDCGLKTRRDEESTPSLENMVKAAKAVRSQL
jgi:5-methyltetrahydropteroyltriglutamate--homocysteine methyltransferase